VGFSSSRGDRWVLTERESVRMKNDSRSQEEATGPQSFSPRRISEEHDGVDNLNYCSEFMVS
jgi:hypothetical protein